MIAEKTILFLQVIATTFMAADYFLTTQQRDKVNEVIQRPLNHIQKNVDKDIDERTAFVSERLAAVAIGFGLMLLILLNVYVAPKLLSNEFLWISTLLSLVLLFIFIYYWFIILDVLLKGILLIGIAAIPKTVIWFLIRCPKGTVFGVGFVFLIASFACRFSNAEG